MLCLIQCSAKRRYNNVKNCFVLFRGGGVFSALSNNKTNFNSSVWLHLSVYLRSIKTTS